MPSLPRSPSTSSPLRRPSRPSVVEAPEVMEAAEPPGPADAIRVAVERASGVSADAAAGVLSALFSEEVSAGTPTVEDHPSDPFSAFDFPVIAAEVSYLAGVLGSTRFILLPADAALLAAAMMGTPETTGDGLSAIELSAVSEAMNQVMTATAGELGAALGIEIEVSPPTCTIVETIEEARESAADCAYRASFRLASTIFGAEIVQLVSAELAAGLADAFAALALAPSEAFDDSSDIDSAFADLPFDGLYDPPPAEPDVRAGSPRGPVGDPGARLGGAGASAASRRARGEPACGLGGHARSLSHRSGGRAGQRHALRPGASRPRRRRVRRADPQPHPSRAHELNRARPRPL